jgi:hypothetical protein
VRNHVDNALDAQPGAALDSGDAALRDRRRDDAPVRKPGDIELGGVFRGATFAIPSMREAGVPM